VRITTASSFTSGGQHPNPAAITITITAAAAPATAASRAGRIAID
jgi:hypothetical protein